MVAWRVAIALLLLSACAQQQPLQKSPVAGPEALGLDRPMTPLTAPVTVGLGPWLPFTRYCEEGTDTVLIAGRTIPVSRRACATIGAEPVDAGWRRLTVTVTEGEFAGASLTLEHSLARQVRGVSFKASPSANLASQEIRLRNQGLEARLGSIAIPITAWVARQDESSDASASLSRMEGLREPKDFTLTCRVEGSSAVSAREVVVASCTGMNPIRMTDPARRIEVSGDTDLAYWVAVDVATGAWRRVAASTGLRGTRTEAGRSHAITGTGWSASTLD